jgi:UDP-N-acetylmuramate--alanine ligase
MINITTLQNEARAKNKFHIIGIGGIGMSGLAEIYHRLGYNVQGSDIQANANTQRLEKLGIKIFIGHEQKNVIGCTHVVCSSAIKKDNPEVTQARLLGQHILYRHEFLAELLRNKLAIGISGTHGKTTTTTMVSHMLENCTFDPTVISGGIINTKDTNAYLGKSDIVVAEADESDGTFIKIPCTIAVATNLDQEHLDFYKTFENLTESFKTFLTSVPFYGFCLACADHAGLLELISTVKTREIYTYGIDNPSANYRAVNVRYVDDYVMYDCIVTSILGKAEDVIHDIVLPSIGKHNILNSITAVAIAHRFGISKELIKQGFKGYMGVKRRFTKVGIVNNAHIIDDYAHHPVEIAATLSMAHDFAQKTKGRVIAVFQPHRYSRMLSLYREFLACFDNAQKLYVSDVYAAGELPIREISGENFVHDINEKRSAIFAKYVQSPEVLYKELESEIKEGDVVVFLGAGSSSLWAYEFSKTSSLKIA